MKQVYFILSWSSLSAVLTGKEAIQVVKDAKGKAQVFLDFDKALDFARRKLKNKWEIMAEIFDPGEEEEFDGF